MNPTAVTLYTSPGCPDCAAVREWLRHHHVPFAERDISRPGVADEAKQRYGVRVAPITVVGEQTFFYGTFDEQRPRLAEALLPPCLQG